MTYKKAQKILIPFAPAKVEITYADGKTIIREGQPRGAIRVDAEKHAIENLRNTEIHAYIVELKRLLYSK
jgi:hypothetical protein